MCYDWFMMVFMLDVPVRMCLNGIEHIHGYENDGVLICIFTPFLTQRVLKL